MLAYVYHALFREGGERGLGIFSSSCKNSFVAFGKCVERFEKKHYILKMYTVMKYQLILHDKNIVCVSSNQPSIPCVKPLRLKLYVVASVSHRHQPRSRC